MAKMFIRLGLYPIVALMFLLPAWADDAKPQDMKSVTNSIGMKFVRVEPGTFTMGSPATEEGHQPDETQHEVTLTKVFYMQTTTVTQTQWRAVMGTTVAQQRDKANPAWPRAGEGDEYPMYYVSWDEAVEFCKKLSQTEGKHYRLPTEAEWEYACRAGTQGPYGGTGSLDEMAWFADNSGDERIDSTKIWQTEPANYNQRVVGDNHGRTHPVGKKKANAWGLYDMHGNVFQWCSDYYAEYTAGPVSDPSGPAQGSSLVHHGGSVKGGRETRAGQNAQGLPHVHRGGSWGTNPVICRAAFRDASAPGRRFYGIGFRLCLDL